MSPVSFAGASSATAVGLSGLRAAQTRLDATAHNVANAQTPGFQRHAVQQTAVADSGGVQTQVEKDDTEQVAPLGHLVNDLVEQRLSVYSFAANLQTIKAQDRMLGALLDQKA